MYNFTVTSATNMCLWCLPREVRTKYRELCALDLEAIGDFDPTAQYLLSGFVGLNDCIGLYTGCFSLLDPDYGKCLAQLPATATSTEDTDAFPLLGRVLSQVGNIDHLDPSKLPSRFIHYDKLMKCSGCGEKHFLSGQLLANAFRVTCTCCACTK